MQVDKAQTYKSTNTKDTNGVNEVQTRDKLQKTQIEQVIKDEDKADNSSISTIDVTNNVDKADEVKSTGTENPSGAKKLKQKTSNRGHR